MIRVLITVAILILLEYYAFQAIRTAVRWKWAAIVYEAISLITIGYIVWSIYNFDRSVGQTQQTMLTLGLLLLVVVPKIAITLVLFCEDLYRFFATIVNYFKAPEKMDEHVPARRQFISQIALGVAAIPFASLIFGMAKGRYGFHVIRETVFFDDLPDSFDGFTITQISDIHSGSFEDDAPIGQAIDLINAQKADMIVFTGDLVNTHATEMHPWIDTFNRIETPPFGKYSVLGNHDYGEYINWKSQAEKQANFNAIKQVHQDIGFKLLLNENRIIRKGNDSIALVGVENWGYKFKKAGDLKKASSGLEAGDFKIVLSHDPSHWEYEVKKHPMNYQLTLSGHTHGFQFGIEIPGVVKWSPAQYFYKQWAGLYENLGRRVYVNRGFGFHAYPGRTGIRPEITVIELKKRSNVA